MKSWQSLVFWLFLLFLVFALLGFTFYLFVDFSCLFVFNVDCHEMLRISRNDELSCRSDNSLCHSERSEESCIIESKDVSLTLNMTDSHVESKTDSKDVSLTLNMTDSHNDTFLES